MDELAPIREKLAAGELVVFVGRDAPQAIAGVPPDRDIAAALGGGRSLASAVAGKPLFQIRPLLEPHVREVEMDALLPTAVARVPTLTFATLSFTNQLAAALTTAVRAPNPLIDNPDLLNRTAGQPDVLHLAGTLARPASLMVAEAQVAVPASRQAVFDRLADWCAAKAVVFVGCDPTAGSDFDRLVFPRLLQNRNVGAGDVLVWPGADAATVARWQVRGIQVLDADPLDVLAHLATVQVVPEDPEAQRLARLANLLTGGGTEPAITAALQAAAGVETVDVTLRFRFRLEDDELHAMLDVAYEPAIATFNDWPHATGLTLNTLTDWADMTEKLLVNVVEMDNPLVLDPARSHFDRILPPGSERRRQYELALDRARILNARPTIQYVVDHPGQLAPIPWELLNDQHVPLGRGYHALNYPVYRLPDGSTAVTSLQQLTGGYDRALLVGIDPDGTLASLPDEVNALRDLLLAANPHLALTVLSEGPTADGPPTRANILAHLSDPQKPVHLLHFTGHGSFARFKPEDSALHVVDEAGGKGWITAVDLGRAVANGGLKLVVLSACSVGLTQEAQGQAEPVPAWVERGMVDALSRSGVPATLGMRWKVGELSARRLTETFYNALFAGAAPPDAIRQARATHNDTPDWINPILEMHPD